jgi:hypothetical protein
LPPDARSRLARRLWAGMVLLASVAGLIAPAATASIGLETGPGRASLQVDAKGNAGVTWTAGAASESWVVPAQGRNFHGELGSPDVSKPVTVGGVPSALAVRRSPSGGLWALQLIQIGAGKPVTLDLSRWRGAPTVLKLSIDGTHLRGTVSFQGKPVTGHSFTLGGLQPRVYVYLDCFGCGGQAGWSPMLGVAPHADGSFALLIRPNWKGSRYRATIAGQNVGSTYEPDAQTVIRTG